MMKKLKIAALCLLLLNLSLSHAIPQDALQCRLVLKRSDKLVAQSPAINIPADKSGNYVAQVLIQDSVWTSAEIVVRPEQGQRGAKIWFSLHDQEGASLAKKQSYEGSDLFVMMREEGLNIFDIEGTGASTEKYVLECRNRAFASEKSPYFSREEALKKLSEELRWYVQESSEFSVLINNANSSMQQLTDGANSFMQERITRRRRGNYIAAASICGAWGAEATFIPLAATMQADVWLVLSIIHGIVSFFGSPITIAALYDSSESVTELRKFLPTVERESAELRQLMERQGDVFVNLPFEVDNQSFATLSHAHENVQNFCRQKMVAKAKNALEAYNGIPGQKNVFGNTPLSKAALAELYVLEEKAQKLSTRYQTIAEILQYHFAPQEWDDVIAMATTASSSTQALPEPTASSTQETLLQGDKCPKSFAPIFARPKKQ